MRTIEKPGDVKGCEEHGEEFEHKEQPSLGVLIRWALAQLLQGLQLLRQDHELCDIVLRVGDSKIHAHKVVLASISPYFKAMFTGNLSEKETSEVEFQCVDEAALQVRFFLYTHRFPCRRIDLQQGWATGGPWATCGPHLHLMRSSG